jgi:GntR family transcriptional regulator
VIAELDANWDPKLEAKRQFSAVIVVLNGGWCECFLLSYIRHKWSYNGNMYLSPKEPLKPASFSPLYRQVKALITESLRAGAWKPGELIPSELELAVQHGVSQGTVRRAIDELAAENLLLRRQGRGTYVASHQSARTEFRFLRLRRDDHEALQLVSEVLECRRVRAPAPVSKQLMLRVGEPVIFIRRLLKMDPQVLVVDDIWLPGRRFRGLSAERLAAYRGPLYGLFEADFATRMVRATERLRAIAAPAPLARVLAIRPSAPVLLVERLSYTYQDQPVEVRKGYYLTTTLHYFNELS